MMKEIRKEGRRFAKYHVTALGIEWEVGRKRETKKETLFYVTGASFGEDRKGKTRVKSIRYSKEVGKAGRFSERMAGKIVADSRRSFNLAIIEAL